MNYINIKKFGFSTGITGALIYLGCILLMNILSGKLLVKMANIIFHGVDFTWIIRMNVSVGESIFGIIVSFLLWGAIGLVFANIYNKIKLI